MGMHVTPSAVQLSIVAHGAERANKFFGIGSGDEVHAGAGKVLVAVWGAPMIEHLAQVIEDRQSPRLHVIAGGRT
jgi:hypothetical protein